MHRNTLTVTISSLLIQLIGFLKLLLIAKYFGAGAELDGYYLALIIPTLLLGFVGGALQTGFMPVYGGLLAKNEHNRALIFRSNLLWISIIVISVLCLIFYMFTPLLMDLMVPNESIGVRQFAGHAFQILIFTLLFNSIADYFSLILNVHQHFLAASLAPLVNIIISTLFLYCWPEWGLDNLIWGLLIGLSVQTIVVYSALKKMGISFHFSFSLYSEDLRKALLLMAPVLIGVALANANFSVDQAMAASAGEGSISILGYASRFHNVVVQAGIMSASIVLLPTLINLVTKKETENAFLLLNKLFLWSFIASTGIISGVFFLGDDVLTLLLSRGAFGDQDVEDVYQVWFWYSVGLFPMACGVFYSKMFQALHLPWVLTQFAIISFCLNIALNLLFIHFYGVSGVAMATTSVYAIISGFFYLGFRRNKWSAKNA